MNPALHSKVPGRCTEYAARACTAEITTFSDVIVVYKFLGDLMFYVTGAQDENELILYQVLQGFYESISLLLRCDDPAHSNAGCCVPPCLPASCLSGKQATEPAHLGGNLLCCFPRPPRHWSVNPACLKQGMQRKQANVTQHVHFVQSHGYVYSLCLFACVQRGCGKEDGAGEPGPGAAGHGRDRGRRVRLQHALCMCNSNHDVTACGLLNSTARMA